MQEPRQIPRQLVDDFFTNNYSKLCRYGFATANRRGYEISEILNRWYLTLINMNTTQDFSKLLSPQGFGLFIRAIFWQDNQKISSRATVQLADVKYFDIAAQAEPTQELATQKLEELVALYSLADKHLKTNKQRRNFNEYVQNGIEGLYVYFKKSTARMMVGDIVRRLRDPEKYRGRQSTSNKFDAIMTWKKREKLRARNRIPICIPKR
jgi:hypothetical protein